MTDTNVFPITRHLKLAAASVLCIAAISGSAHAQQCNTYNYGSQTTTSCSNGTQYNTYRYGNQSTTTGSDGSSWYTNRYGNQSTTTFTSPPPPPVMPQPYIPGVPQLVMPYRGGCDLNSIIAHVC